MLLRDMCDARADVCCDAAAAQGFISGTEDLNLMLAIECERAECDTGLVVVVVEVPKCDAVSAAEELSGLQIAVARQACVSNASDILISRY